MKNTDVVLVAMPFCDEYMPCMTYAMFKAMLTKAGISSCVQHEYLYYAAWIGKKNYRRIMQVCTIGYGHDYFACETIFAAAAGDSGDPCPVQGGPGESPGLSGRGGKADYGEEAQLCRSCRDVIEESALIKELSGQFDESEIMESLAWLVEKNLILKIGSEYLTLAVDRDAHLQSF